eukprot:276449-Prorocentrum_minimum.AAC.2
MVRPLAKLPPRGGRLSQRLQGLVVADHQRFRPELADLLDQLLQAGVVGYHAHVHRSDGLGATCHPHLLQRCAQLSPQCPVRGLRGNCITERAVIFTVSRVVCAPFLPLLAQDP